MCADGILWLRVLLFLDCNGRWAASFKQVFGLKRLSYTSEKQDFLEVCEWMHQREYLVASEKNRDDARDNN